MVSISLSSVLRLQLPAIGCGLLARTRRFYRPARLATVCPCRQFDMSFSTSRLSSRFTFALRQTCFSVVLVPAPSIPCAMVMPCRSMAFRWKIRDRQRGETGLLQCELVSPRPWQRRSHTSSACCWVSASAADAHEHRCQTDGNNTRPSPSIFSSPFDGLPAPWHWYRRPACRHSVH